MPYDVKPRIADDLSQEDYNLGSPDLYGGDDSGLAHTGNEINTIELVKEDMPAKSTL
jgi:hypothetical protein